MPNDFFQIYNHAYSFATSKVFSAGVTYSLPQNDYGIYGQQVDAQFNSLSNSPGGTGNLVAWFVSDAGLTYYSNALGASAAVTAYISSKFPVTSSTGGLGLIDLRGSADWNQIVGDGIIGATKASSTSISSTNTQRYINGVTTLFNQLSTAYPNIDWAIAGLPYIPYEMTYAPIVGTAPAWDRSLTNNGNYTSPYWWDPQHPTGNTDQLYTWSSPPSALSAFYKTVVSSGPQNSILSACDVGWICPDVRVPYTDALPFYEHGYDAYANYNRNKTLVEIASTIGNNKLVRTYPLISSMYPSRELNQYDDHGGLYLNLSRERDAYGNLYSNIGGTSFYGITAAAAESFYPAITFRLDMIYASVQGNAHGFIYYDPAPSMVAIACTGTIASGATGSVLQTRARNMFSNMMYGGPYSQYGYGPSEGYTAQSVQSELLRYCAKESMGYLNEIRESVNLSDYGAGNNQFYAGQNGWMRSASDPNSMSFTIPLNQTSTNTVASDAIYGEQTWPESGADSFAGCCTNPCDPPPTSGQCCCITVTTRTFTNPCCCPFVNIQVSAPPNAPANCSQCCQPTTITVSADTVPCNVGDCTCTNRSWSASSSCGCVVINNQGNNNGDDTYGGSVGSGLACYCGDPSGSENTTPCGGGGGGGGVDTSSTEIPSASDGASTTIYANANDTISGGGSSAFTSRPSLILDFQNYKRAANANHFILTRGNNQPIKNWLDVYSTVIDTFSIPVFYQASDTILNPSASYRALQTHSNKDYARHYPNLYFKP